MPFLQFKGKAAVETYHHTVPHHTLEFDRKLSVLGKGEEPGLDGNLIVEGDNLLALKALLPTHAGRVKCIYIDPPYNTGNEGWVYNDNLTQPQFKEWIGQTVGKDEEDACRHDKWCCMMYPRLMLLKELLANDGLIFVSIDDTEVDNLNLLMDEVFGADNRVERMVWKKSYGGGAKERYIVRLHEYILCYARNKGEVEKLDIAMDEDSIARYYVHKDAKFTIRGPYRLKPLEATKSMDARDNLVYSIPYKGTELRPKRQWWWRKERTLKAIDEDEIEFVETPSGISVNYKQYLRDANGTERRAKLFSIIDGIFTQEGTDDLTTVFGGKMPLQFPKPVRLVKTLVSLIAEPGDIVLDSFAGSGTTGQAVMALNSEDDGGRKFILVQQSFDTKEDESNKRNICKEITAERVRRVMKGYPFTGWQTEVLLEEKVTLTGLKKADELLARMDAVKQANAGKFDDITAECKDGVVRVLGVKDVKGKTEGLGGAFSYARLSEQPLFGEYRNLGETLPPYEEIAKYVFYTETSRQWSPKGMNKKTGFIGAHAGRSYYLLYRPSAKSDWALDMEFLREVAAKDDNREIVVYCEKIWAHRSDRAEWEAQTGKRLRAMLVPFNLK